MLNQNTDTFMPSSLYKINHITKTLDDTSFCNIRHLSIHKKITTTHYPATAVPANAKRRESFEIQTETVDFRPIGCPVRREPV